MGGGGGAVEPDGASVTTAKAVVFLTYPCSMFKCTVTAGMPCDVLQSDRVLRGVGGGGRHVAFIMAANGHHSAKPIKGWTTRDTSCTPHCQPEMMYTLDGR